MKNVTLNNNNGGETTLGRGETEELKCLISFILLDLRTKIGQGQNLEKCYDDAQYYLDNNEMYSNYFKAVLQKQREELIDGKIN